MKLFSRDFTKPGEDRDSIIVLHGLFGSSKNWMGFAKSFSPDYNVYLVDQRNHGDSPHSQSHTIPDMASDLNQFIVDKKIESPILLGHSMGGLVAMYYSLVMEREGYPHISKLIVQDIAPREYPFDYDNEVESMQIDMSDCKSRSDVDKKMEPLVPNAFIRQFLQMNLERKEEGGYYWKINVDVISQSRKMFGDLFFGLKTSKTSSLFILGGESPFIRKGDSDLIKKFFSDSSIQFIQDSGHYMQYTHAEEFQKLIKSWLNK